MEEAVLAALRGVKAPDGSGDLVTLGLIRNLKVAHGMAVFTVALRPSTTAWQGLIDTPIKAALRDVPGVTDSAVHYLVGPEVAPAPPPGPPPVSKASITGPKGTPPTVTAPAGVKQIIAIGSGKGGVGKSTVTINLALALANTPLPDGRQPRVGVLDADIYGPSVPFLLGVANRKPEVKGEKLMPIMAHGIAVMSMGFLLPEIDEPVVWRGPMLASALRQFFNDVDWGELDYLLVDLPPGTGDIPLSLVQLIPLAGAVIVLTPQPVAAAIGVKTLRMLQQLRVPIMGVVENMSHFVCGHCGKETDIFARGGGRQVAEREGIPFLGEIPLDPAIRESGDVGTPLLVSEPDAPQALAFRRLASGLRDRLAMIAPATRS